MQEDDAEKSESENDKSKDERLINLVLAATGYESVEEMRQEPSAEVAYFKAMKYAKKFLEDIEADFDQESSGSTENSPPSFATNQPSWYDMKFQSPFTGGPARPKPPVRRQIEGSKKKESFLHWIGREIIMLFLIVGISIIGMLLVVLALTLAASRVHIPNVFNTNETDVPKNTTNIGKSMPTLAPVILEPTVAPTSYPTTAPVAALTIAPTVDEAARFEDIMSLLVDTGFAEETKLRNGITAQSKALDWLVSHYPVGLTSLSKDLLQRYVLGVLFYSTSGRKPKLTDSNNTNWKIHNLWLTGENYCQWHGIKCMGETNLTMGNAIVDINLSENKLKGTIPSELAGLSDLQSLDFRSNSLNGAIPFEFKFPAINETYMDSNHLNGTINLQLQFMKELQTLSLGHNHFTGTLPAAIGLANKLRYINLKDNQLSGTLPTEMSNLTKLVPSALGSRHELQKLDVSKNDFVGSMPSEICELIENGKLIHLKADCGSKTDGTTTALDMSSFFGNNRRNRKRKLVEIQSRSLEENATEDEDEEEETIFATSEAEADPEVTEEDEEVIAEGDFIYLEEDGTVEDKDGNVIEGVALGDLEVARDQLSGGKGDLPEGYLYTDREPIEGAASEGLEVAGEQLYGGNRDLPDGYLYTDSAPSDKLTNKQTSLNLGDEVEVGDDHFDDIDLAQPITLDEENDYEGSIAYARQRNGEEDENGNLHIPPRQRVPLDNQGGSKAAAATIVAHFGCSCCTYCLADPAVSMMQNHEVQVDLPDIPIVDEPILPGSRIETLPDIEGPALPSNDADILSQEITPTKYSRGIEEPTAPNEQLDIVGEEELADKAPAIFSRGFAGSSDCDLAIRSRTTEDQFPGFLGMNAQMAKHCLEANTNRAVVLVRGNVRRQFPYQNNRILLYVDQNGNVANTPTLGR
ncbi:MAG: hypothetical protein SGBAC_009402 [Bacillariaceae sp.]